MPAVLAVATSSFVAPLVCGPSGPVYSVSLDGASLFSQSAPLSLFTDGAFVTGPAAFALTAAANVTGTDVLGAYTGTECAYALASSGPGTFFTAAAYVYATPAAAPTACAVRFKYGFPVGAAATNHSVRGKATFGTVSNFPAFTGPGTSLPHILTWRDAFFGPSNSVTDTLGQIASTFVMYGDDVSGRAVAVSPLDQFLNAALGDDLGDGTACPGNDAGCFVGGLSATVTSIPPGFVHSFVLVSDLGFTRTVDSWGQVLRAAYGGTSTRIYDPSVSTLAYTTDNGAQRECSEYDGTSVDRDGTLTHSFPASQCVSAATAPWTRA